MQEYIFIINLIGLHPRTTYFFGSLSQNVFNLFEYTCYKFDVKIATILAYQLQKTDSDFGDYVSLLMRKQTLEEQRWKIMNCVLYSVSLDQNIQ